MQENIQEDFTGQPKAVSVVTQITGPSSPKRPKTMPPQSAISQYHRQVSKDPSEANTKKEFTNFSLGIDTESLKSKTSVSTSHITGSPKDTPPKDSWNNVAESSENLPYTDSVRWLQSSQRSPLGGNSSGCNQQDQLGLPQSTSNLFVKKYNLRSSSLAAQEQSIPVKQSGRWIGANPVITPDLENPDWSDSSIQASCYPSLGKINSRSLGKPNNQQLAKQEQNAEQQQQQLATHRPDASPEGASGDQPETPPSPKTPPPIKKFQVGASEDETPPQTPTFSKRRLIFREDCNEESVLSNVRSAPPTPENSPDKYKDSARAISDKSEQDACSSGSSNLIDQKEDDPWGTDTEDGSDFFLEEDEYDEILEQCNTKQAYKPPEPAETFDKVTALSMLLKAHSICSPYQDPETAKTNYEKFLKENWTMIQRKAKEVPGMSILQMFATGLLHEDQQQ